VTKVVGSTNDEDAVIITAACELCQTMKIGFRPTAIAWMGNLGDPRNLSSDQVAFIDKGPKHGRMVLPSALREKLQTEDWRPLISSSLFFQFSPEFRRVWRGLGRMLLISLFAGLFAGPLIAILLPLRYNFAPEVAAFVSFSAVALIVFFLFLIHFSIRFFNLHVVRGLRLKADRKSAHVVGREQFLGTLEKIDAMGIEDLEDRKTESRTIWKGRVSIWPTVTERIENLRRE